MAIAVVGGLISSTFLSLLYIPAIFTIVDDIAGFYGKHGVNAKTFADTMGSFAVAAKVNRAKQFAHEATLLVARAITEHGSHSQP